MCKIVTVFARWSTLRIARSSVVVAERSSPTLTCSASAETWTSRTAAVVAVASANNRSRQSVAVAASRNLEGSKRSSGKPQEMTGDWWSSQGCCCCSEIVALLRGNDALAEREMWKKESWAIAVAAAVETEWLGSLAVTRMRTELGRCLARRTPRRKRRFPFGPGSRRSLAAAAAVAGVDWVIVVFVERRCLWKSWRRPLMAAQLAAFQQRYLCQRPKERC